MGFSGQCVTVTATAPGGSATLVAPTVPPLLGQSRSDHAEQGQVSLFSNIPPDVSRGKRERSQGDLGCRTGTRRLDHPEMTPSTPQARVPRGTRALWGDLRTDWEVTGLGRGARVHKKCVCVPSRDMATGCHPCTAPGAGGATFGPAHCTAIPARCNGDGGRGRCGRRGTKACHQAVPMERRDWHHCASHASILMPSRQLHSRQSTQAGGMQAFSSVPRNHFVGWFVTPFSS